MLAELLFLYNKCRSGLHSSFFFNKFFIKPIYQTYGACWIAKVHNITMHFSVVWHDMPVEDHHNECSTLYVKV